MRMNEGLTIELPKDIPELTGLSPREIQKKSRLMWALEMCSQGIITLSRAAEVSQLSIDEFLEEFRKNKLKRIGGPEDVQEAQKDLENLKKILMEENE